MRGRAQGELKGPDPPILTLVLPGSSPVTSASGRAKGASLGLGSYTTEIENHVFLFLLLLTVFMVKKEHHTEAL